MLKFTDKKIVNECLRRIEFYVKHKNNDMYDDFYLSHLNCMSEILEGYLGALENYFYVICAIYDNKYGTGECTPNYVTVCKKPHWESEGLMITSGLHDATKFDLESSDLTPIIKYCEKRFPDKKFEAVLVDKRILGNILREVWSNEEIRGDFDETGKISDNFVKEV